MTRFIRAALITPLVLSLFSPMAYAAKWVDVPLTFRHYVTGSSAPAGTLLQDIKPTPSTTAQYCDSLVATWNSSGSGPALVSDTTVAFSIPGWAHQQTAVQVAADSLKLFQVQLYPAGEGYAAGTGFAADSFDVVLQGSFNGVDWAAAPAIDILEIGSTNQFERTWNTTTSASAPATATNVTMGYYPLFRLIFKDFTGTTGPFRARARYVAE